MNPHPLTEVFSTVVSLSWRAGWLIVVLAALRLAVRGRVPAQVWFTAWILVALRLLLPFSVPVAWSPYNWAVTPPPPAAGGPAVGVATPVSVSMVPPGPAPVVNTVAPAPAESGWSWRGILAAAWIAGAGGLVALRLVGSVMFRRKLRSAPPADEARLRAVLVREAGTGAQPDLIVTEAVDAPALCGVFRPRLLFPPGLAAKLGDEELRHVVRHELGHWRRRDLLAQGLMQLAVAVHWFNPLVWLAARLARTDCELACDEFVLRRGPVAGASAYGATLLKVLGMVRPRRQPGAVVAMLEDREQLAQRIRMIAGYRGATTGRMLGGALLVGVLAAASVTRESHAEEKTSAAPAKVTEAVALPVAVAATAPRATPVADQLAPAWAAVRDLTTTVAMQRERVEQLARELQVFKEKNDLLSLDQSRDLAAAALRATSAEVQRTGAVLSAAEARLTQLKDSRVRQADLTDLPFIANQPVIVQLKQQLAAANIEAATLGERYREAHPGMKKALNAIAEIEKELARAVESAGRQIEAEQRAAVLSHDTARKELELRKAESFELERVALTYSEKERELRTQEQILQTLMTRMSDASMAEVVGGKAAPGSPAGDFSVSVVGAVHTQTSVGFSGKDRPVLLDLIARVGGFAPRADRNGVQVIRQSPGGGRTTLRLTERELMQGADQIGELQPGDIVVVPELPESLSRGEVSALGALNTPGAYAVPGDGKLMLVDLVAKAGGFTRIADGRKVRVTRRGPQGAAAKVFVIDVMSFLNGAAGADASLVLEPGDVVFVPERVL